MMNMEYLTLDNLEFALALVGLVAGFAFPKYLSQVKVAQKILADVTEFVKKSDKPNQEIFKEAKEKNLKSLADHINKTVDPHINFYDSK